MLSSTLPDLEPVADDPRARSRRAELWEKLGELRRKSHDTKSAIEALETAVGIDERPGQRPGRCWPSCTATRPNTPRRRWTTTASWCRPTSPATSRCARWPGPTPARAGVDWARCCFEVLELLGLAEKKDRAFLAAHPPPARKPEDPYATSIEDADRARYLAHPEARVMSEVFAAIWEGVPGLGGPSLESLGLTPLDKVSPIADVVIAQIFGQIAKALGNRRASLYVSPQAGVSGLRILVPAPPAIVVGPAAGRERPRRAALPARAGAGADPPRIHPGRGHAGARSSPSCSPAC